MKALLLSFLFISIGGNLFAQNKDFYGKAIDKSICPIQTEIVDNKDATDALNKICSAADIPNNFVVVPCPEIGNCFAVYKDGVSYILYDPKFFKRVQTFGFTEKNLPNSVDWAALTILAHELGHHLCQHTTNLSLSSKYTPVELELQADEFAGAIMYRLGATLVQAQKAMNTNGVTDKASLTHPAKKDRLDAIAKGYNKNAKRGGNNSSNSSDIPSDGKITIVVPQFQIIAENVKYNMAEQMKQILVSGLQNDGTYHIVASSFDIQNFRNDPAVAYGGEQAIKRANYVLLGKIISYQEKNSSFGVGTYKASLGTTLHYRFSFEVINAKTNEMVLVKNWELKIKSGTVGVSTGANGVNGAVALDPDVAAAYEKKIGEIIKFITEQKSKITFN